MTGTYALDNSHAAATAHHEALSQLLDPFTRDRVRGLVDDGDWSGGRVLEVGAGHGSIARWLAGEVGAGGEVVALDLDPRHIPAHPRLRAVAHDLTDDRSVSALTGCRFDLIHARLTLAHLPQRDAILDRLAEALVAGGVLLVEDWAARNQHTVVAAPSVEAAELHAAYQRAAAAAFDAAGTDRSWAQRIHRAMLDLGLVDVETVLHASYWAGGGPGCRLIAATMPQLWPSLTAAGMTVEQLERERESLADPRLILHGHLLYSTSARRT